MNSANQPSPWMTDGQHADPILGAGAVGAMEAGGAMTIEYCKEREAFGGSLTQFQNTRFKLAEAKTNTGVARAFFDSCLSVRLWWHKRDYERTDRAELVRGLGGKLICLRREYLEKNENAPLPASRGDFTLYGHRLSSLYRAIKITKVWLTNRYLISFFSKYSNPALTTGAAL